MLNTARKSVGSAFGATELNCSVKEYNYQGNGTQILAYEKMEDDSVTLLQVGAWGQLAVIALAVAFWYLGLATTLYVACLGYFLVTLAGIIGIGRNASAIVGPLIYPFIIPGFVPLYYFAVRETVSDE